MAFVLPILGTDAYPDRVIQSSLIESAMFRNLTATVVVSLCFACSAVGAFAEELSEDGIKAYYAAWSANDIKGVMRHFHDKCVYEDVATGDLASGHDEVRAFAKKFLDGTPGVKVVPASITIDSERAAVEWIMSAGSGEEAWSVRGVAIIEHHDGRISRATDYWNTE